MTLSQSTLAELAMQKAEAYAKRVFKDPHQIADAISTAWEFAQAGKGTPATIAAYAVRRVRSNRQHGQSTRMVDHSDSRNAELKPKRLGFDLELISRPGDDPAEIAAFRVDFAAWLETLDRSLRRTVLLMASGEQTSQLAKRFRLSAGRISQIRKLLNGKWLEYQGLE